MQMTSRKIQAQKGAVLLTSLVILLVLTLLGLNSMQTTVLEERMAGNFRDRDLALNAAETALREAESVLGVDAGETVPTESASKPSSDALVWILDAPITASAATGYWWNDATEAWWDANAERVTFDATVVSEGPLYITEKLATIGDGDSLQTGLGTGNSSANPYHYYRVTARGTGKQDSSKVTLQSIFRRKFSDQ